MNHIDFVVKGLILSSRILAHMIIILQRSTSSSEHLIDLVVSNEV
jgi:hypothetical protein